MASSLSSKLYYQFSSQKQQTTHITSSQNLTIKRTINKYSALTKNSHIKGSKQDYSMEVHINRYCPCCSRRNVIGSLLGTGFFPISHSFALDNTSLPNDPLSVLNRIHPPRPDWYEELYASVMDKSMKAYEAEIAGYKSRLFEELRGKADKILEIGIGTGPNLKYYADYPGVSVVGVDPNRKMEKYAIAAAMDAGISSSNFKFMQAVAEALPLNDASVDVVIGTLVLCSVNGVTQTLQEVKRVLKPGGSYVFVEHVAAKDGTFLRFIQGILDPLQQTVADGCHLTRNTASDIAKAGFASLDVNQASLSSASLINPHVYGIARMSKNSTI